MYSGGAVSHEILTGGTVPADTYDCFKKNGRGHWYVDFECVATGLAGAGAEGVNAQSQEKIAGMMQNNPGDRPTAQQLLESDWLKDVVVPYPPPQEEAVME